MPPDSNEEISPHIRLRIDRDVKREWLEHIEESAELETLTDLIKDSVNRSISGEWELVNADTDTEIPTDLTDTLNGIDSRLEVIETQLDETALGDADPSDQDLSEQELMELARRCHDNLPVVQSGGHLRELTTHVDIQLPVDLQAKVSGTAQDISAYIDEPVHQVRKALIYLERQETASVESIIHEGTRRWFEKRPDVERDIVSRLELEDEVDEPLNFHWASESDDWDPGR